MFNNIWGKNSVKLPEIQGWMKYLAMGSRLDAGGRAGKGCESARRRGPAGVGAYYNKENRQGKSLPEKLTEWHRNVRGKDKKRKKLYFDKER